MDVKELFRAWHSSMSNSELCRHLRVTSGTLWSLGKKYGLPHRGTLPGGKRTQQVDPTPEEIAERAAECRARRPVEEQARDEAAGRCRWEMPCYAFSRRDLAFSEAAG